MGPPISISTEVHNAKSTFFYLIVNQTPSTAALLDKDISLFEVLSILQHLPKEKSPGWDGITNEFFAKYAVQLAPSLTQLCQSIWDSGIMPNSWKIGIIKLYMVL